MRVVIVDCGAVRSESDLWHAYLQAARPDGARYFGRNLAAFNDALDGGPGWPGECELRFINLDTVRTFRDGEFLERLRDVARRSSAVTITFDS